METITEEKIEQKTQTTSGWVILLHNDEVNTFEHVIYCLMKYCGHTPMQAEQCATIVHNNGKIDVKHGTFDDLLPIHQALLDNKLSSTIAEQP